MELEAQQAAPGATKLSILDSCGYTWCISSREAGEWKCYGISKMGDNLCDPLPGAVIALGAVLIFSRIVWSLREKAVTSRGAWEEFQNIFTC